LDLHQAAEYRGVLIQEIFQKIEHTNSVRLAHMVGSDPWADANRMVSKRRLRLDFNATG
jgi:hypothetical protein